MIRFKKLRKGREGARRGGFCRQTYKNEDPYDKIEGWHRPVRRWGRITHLGVKSAADNVQRWVNR